VVPFPTVTGIVVTGATPVLPGSTIVERIRFLRIRFDLALDNPPGDTGIDDASNPANYLLVRSGVNGVFDTSSCLAGVAGDDVNIVVDWVRYPFGGDSARIYFNWGYVLQTGDYRLLVCGATSITAGGIPLAGDGVNAGTDFLFDFSVILPSRLPDTGFPPDKISQLSGELLSVDSYQNSGLVLEIPRLDLSIPITSIPFQDTTWDVTWLSNQVGWLEGTAFPTWGGNSVLTGHVVNASGLPGPFAELGSLRYGDQIIIQGWGQNYIYEVRSVKNQNAEDFSTALQHEEYPWITLITCTGYTPFNEIYSSRIIVRAVQVGIK
jgi:LPXTG-site transpeptidase (sortase) family protein